MKPPVNNSEWLDFRGTTDFIPRIVGSRNFINLQKSLRKGSFFLTMELNVLVNVAQSCIFDFDISKTFICLLVFKGTVSRDFRPLFGIYLLFLGHLFSSKFSHSQWYNNKSRNKMFEKERKCFAYTYMFMCPSLPKTVALA